MSQLEQLSAAVSTRTAGIVLAAIALVFVFTARIQLGKAFSIQPQAKGLVTRGLYSRIRNPMYVFLDIMIFGVILALRLNWLFLLLGILVIVQIRQVRREAAVLQQKFGQAYLDYRKQTWF